MWSPAEPSPLAFSSFSSPWQRQSGFSADPSLPSSSSVTLAHLESPLLQVVHLSLMKKILSNIDSQRNKIDDLHLDFVQSRFLLLFRVLDTMVFLPRYFPPHLSQISIHLSARLEYIISPQFLSQGNFLIG